MARQKPEKIYHIAVIGMSGTETERGATGVGKSCLCNRFMHPHQDRYFNDHISVISSSDFSGRIVNNDHFLYWGETVKKYDGDSLTFRVIEQTEFIDDSSFSPLRGSNTHNYFKRAAVSNLKSAEKVMYICKDQVGDETNFPQNILPDGKFPVDGFLVIYDVSKSSGHEKQHDWLVKLHGQLHKAKRPVVVVATKWDEAWDPYVRDARAFANKIKATLIETSSQEGVNVDLAFVTLASKIDKRGAPREVPFTSANEARQKVIHKAVDEYEGLLQREVTNYHDLWTSKKKQFQHRDVFQKVVELIGTKNAKTYFTRHTQRLRQNHQQMKMKLYLGRLPDALESIFPDLNSISGRDWTESRQILPQLPNFSEWFILLPSDQTWRESEYIDTDDLHIPYDLLEGHETECENCFTDHVNRLNAAKRKEKMKSEFKKLLESLPNIVLPNRPMDEDVVKDAICNHESFKELDESALTAIYNLHQEDILAKAQFDFAELLVEKHALLASVDIMRAPRDEVEKVVKQLEGEPRYQKLAEMHHERYVMLIKQLAFVQNPTAESCYSAEKCMDRLTQLCIERSVQKSPLKDSPGMWDDFNNKLSIIVMGEDGLADELDSEIKSQSYDGDYTLDKVLYSLELKTIEGDITHPSNQLVTDRFTPQGCICVFTSLEGFQYVSECLERTILSDREEYNSSTLRDLAVVLMFGRSTSPEADTAQVREQAERLCQRLNNCRIVNVPPDNTTLWQGKKFSESQIQDALRSVVAGQKYRSGTPNQTESDRGSAGDTFRIGLCMPCGDPFQPDLVLSPVTSHTCVATPNEKNCITCDMFLIDTKCRVDFEVASYHLADSLKEQRVHHGYILVYAAQRKASIALLRWFLKIVQPIPTLVVAVCEDINSAAEGIAEGNRLVDETETAKLVTANCSSFRDQTVIYNRFLKEAYDKRRETERTYKLRVEETVPPSPGHRPPMELPSPHDGSIDEAQTPTSGGESDSLYDSIGLGERRHSTKANSEDLYAMVDTERERAPPKPLPDASASEDLYAMVDKQRERATPKPVQDDSVPEEQSGEAVDDDNVKKPGGKTTKRDPGGRIIFKPSVVAKQSNPGLYAEVIKDRQTSTPDPNRQPEGSGMVDNILYDSFGTPGQDDSMMMYTSVSDTRRDFNQSEDLSREAMEENPLYESYTQEPKPKGPPTAPKPGFQKVKNKPQPPVVASTPRPSALPSSTTGDNTPDTDTYRQRAYDRATPYKRPIGTDAKNRMVENFLKGLDKLIESSYSMDSSFQDSEAETPSNGKPHKPNKHKPKKEQRLKPKKGKYPPIPKKPPKPPLEQLILNEYGIPSFIEQCVQRIEEEGISQEGIYRVSGKAADIETIIKMFDEDQNANLNSLENLSSNTIASALKQFFKNLPEPIIPYSTQDKMISDYKEVNNEEQFVERLPEYLVGLTTVKRTVLTFMMQHMKRVTEYHESNKMKAENVAICWCPSILQVPPEDFHTKWMILTRILQLMTENSELFVSE